jgi:pimeloyl-ACP methyl ester carboxylesterase
MTAPSREQTRARYPDESGYVQSDGVRVYCEAYGTGEPTILFLPTWEIVHSRAWKFQIPYFARHGRVVTFDRRGNGVRTAPSMCTPATGGQLWAMRSRCWIGSAPGAWSLCHGAAPGTI